MNIIMKFIFMLFDKRKKGKYKKEKNELLFIGRFAGEVCIFW